MTSMINMQKLDYYFLAQGKKTLANWNKDFNLIFDIPHQIRLNLSMN